MDAAAEPGSPRPTDGKRSDVTGCLKWTALGCGGLLALGIVLAVVIGAVVLGSIRSSGAYEQALADVRESPRMQEALGTPIEPGWWVSGSVDVSGPSGEAGISFPVSGPEGEATVYVEASRRAGRWILTLLEAELEGGERIDLLGEETGAREVIEAFLEAAGDGDWEAAHGHFSGPLREAQPYEEFVSMGEGNAGLFRVEETRLDSSRAEEGPRYEGTVVLEGGQEIPATFTLVREDGEWRLIAYNLGS